MTINNIFISYQNPTNSMKSTIGSSNNYKPNTIFNECMQFFIHSLLNLNTVSKHISREISSQDVYVQMNENANAALLETTILRSLSDIYIPAGIFY